MKNYFTINYKDEQYDFEIDKESKSYISPITRELIPFNINPHVILNKHVRNLTKEIKISLTIRNYDGISKEELLASIERGLEKQGIYLMDYEMGE
ncbi:MAG: hypothetical protein GX265_01060 [Mollicutes bacterium]|nr:hypothetical protein [Mollicutes bacterium]